MAGERGVWVEAMGKVCLAEKTAPQVVDLGVAEATARRGAKGVRESVTYVPTHPTLTHTHRKAEGTCLHTAVCTSLTSLIHTHTHSLTSLIHTHTHTHVQPTSVHCLGSVHLLPGSYGACQMPEGRRRLRKSRFFGPKDSTP